MSHDTNDSDHPLSPHFSGTPYHGGPPHGGPPQGGPPHGGPPYGQGPAHHGSPVDAREIMRVLWRRKLLFLVPFSLAFTAGLSGAFLLKPIYVSQVTLVLERPQQLSGQLRPISCASRPRAACS